MEETAPREPGRSWNFKNPSFLNVLGAVSLGEGPQRKPRPDPRPGGGAQHPEGSRGGCRMVAGEMNLDSAPEP